jgi:translation initiation factor 1
MAEICPVCGQPQELCVCKEIAKEGQRITVRTIQRKFRKVVTLISGFESKEQAKQLGKMLKKELACGGTIKNDAIELQGDHKEKVKELLAKWGYKDTSVV